MDQNFHKLVTVREMNKKKILQKFKGILPIIVDER